MLLFQNVPHFYIRYNKNSCVSMFLMSLFKSVHGVSFDVAEVLCTICHVDVMVLFLNSQQNVMYSVYARQFMTL